MVEGRGAGGSTGNHGSTTPRFPAGHRGVMGVAATDPADSMASWSSHGQAAFIAAPGVNIQTIEIGDAYAVFSGTSTSAAIVAGSAALLKATDPTLPNGVIVYRLASTADPAATQEQTGNGRVNLARALASTATESIQPAGADPVGEGGPLVGPYMADTVSALTLNSPTTAAPITVTSLPAAINVTFTYSSSGAAGTAAEAEVVLGSSTVSSGVHAVPTGDNQTQALSVTIPAGTANGSYRVQVQVNNATVPPGPPVQNAGQNGAVIVNVPTDATPPTTTITLAPATPNGNNDWYVSDVTVTVSAVDNDGGSGVAETRCVLVLNPTTPPATFDDLPEGCTTPTTVSADGMYAVYAASRDHAGNKEAVKSKSFKIDKTPPTTTITLNPMAPNGDNGWYRVDVVVEINPSDATSGVGETRCVRNPTTAPADFDALPPGICNIGTVSADGMHVVYAASKDNAGNKEAVKSKAFKIDQTPPTVNLVGDILGANSYYFGFVPPEPTCTASDETSGLAGPCVVEGYGTTVGTHTVKATARDNAGNVKTDEHTYTVLAWTNFGFYRPVDMGDVWNTVRAGSTVPLKFDVFAGPTELADVAFIGASLTSTPVGCVSGYDEAEIELVATGGTSLRYDLTEGQFIFNWQTPKAPGKCYIVTMKTADGTSISAKFKLR